jgi:hypothetical protein
MATDISLTTSGGATTDVGTTGKIKFTNNTGVGITAFTLPTCVSPQTPPTLPFASGATTGDYQINNSANGSYSYSYTIPSDSGDTLSGTIDVS